MECGTGIRKAGQGLLALHVHAALCLQDSGEEVEALLARLQSQPPIYVRNHLAGLHSCQG